MRVFAHFTIGAATYSFVTPAALASAPSVHTLYPHPVSTPSTHTLDLHPSFTPSIHTLYEHPLRTTLHAKPAFTRSIQTLYSPPLFTPSQARPLIVFSLHPRGTRGTRPRPLSHSLFTPSAGPIYSQPLFRLYSQTQQAPPLTRSSLLPHGTRWTLPHPDCSRRQRLRTPSSSRHWHRSSTILLYYSTIVLYHYTGIPQYSTVNNILPYHYTKARSPLDGEGCGRARLLDTGTVLLLYYCNTVLYYSTASQYSKISSPRLSSRHWLRSTSILLYYCTLLL